MCETPKCMYCKKVVDVSKSSEGWTGTTSKGRTTYWHYKCYIRGLPTVIELSRATVGSLVTYLESVDEPWANEIVGKCGYVKSTV